MLLTNIQILVFAAISCVGSVLSESFNFVPTTTTCGTKVTTPAPYELTPEQLDDFRRDGVLVVRQFLRGEMLEDAIQGVEMMERSRGVVQKMFYKIFPSYRNLSTQNYRTVDAFKKVAFNSAAPTIAAKLMGLDNDSNRTIRLLKEGIFGFGRGDRGCGWHVDDKFFWPCEDSHSDAVDGGKSQKDCTGLRDAGINVWITLSPVTAREGGGLAIAPRSHDLTGRGKIGKLALRARKAIAAKGAQTTCALETLEPDCHADLEAMKKVYDLEPGDAIFHDRYIFHRSDHFNDIDGDDQQDATDQKFRISLRYMPSDATYFNLGAGLEGAATEKHLETGDPISKAGEYFPQVWPTTLAEEVNAEAKADQQLNDVKGLIRMVTRIVSKIVYG